MEREAEFDVNCIFSTVKDLLSRIGMKLIPQGFHKYYF